MAWNLVFKDKRLLVCDYTEQNESSNQANDQPFTYLTLCFGTNSNVLLAKIGLSNQYKKSSDLINSLGSLGESKFDPEGKFLTFQITELEKAKLFIAFIESSSSFSEKVKEIDQFLMEGFDSILMQNGSYAQMFSKLQISNLDTEYTPEPMEIDNVKDSQNLVAKMNRLNTIHESSSLGYESSYSSGSEYYDEQEALENAIKNSLEDAGYETDEDTPYKSPRP